MQATQGILLRAVAKHVTVSGGFLVNPIEQRKYYLLDEHQRPAAVVLVIYPQGAAMVAGPGTTGLKIQEGGALDLQYIHEVAEVRMAHTKNTANKAPALFSQLIHLLDSLA